MGRKGVIGMLFGLMMKITLLYTDILPRWGKWCGLSPFFNKNSVLDGTGLLHRSNILYQTEGSYRLPRRWGSMFWGWLPTTQTPPAPSLKTALVFTNISARWDGKGLSECFLD